MKITNLKVILLLLLITISSQSFGQIPSGYYDGTEDLQNTNLRRALNLIISGHTVYTYTSTNTDTWDILKESDADPNNSSNVIFVYSGRSVDGAQEYNNGSGWTREHVWPESRGDFGTTRGTGTDLHNLKPCDVSVNSARSNRWFNYADTYYYDNGVNTGSKTSYDDFVWEPREEVKGDIARIIFYMATRYDGWDGELDLEVVDYFPLDNSDEPFMSLLNTLKIWHEIDPVDNFEINRNEVIYSYQNNRNPFIDHPEFVEKIWGGAVIEGQELFISEYIEGSGYDKAIELYNNSGNPIDLSMVKLEKDNDGDNCFTNTLSLSGTIGAYSVYVIANNKASSEIQAKAHLTTSSMTMAFNGDDQLRLLYNGVEIDHVGNSGNYGQDRTFVRAGHVSEASSVKDYPETSYNWITLNNGNHNHLGYHYTNETLITPQLLISEYIEGSSYNKGIEIYNASSEIIDLSDVSILKQTNGSGGFGGFSLSGDLNPYEVFCIVHPDANTVLLNKANLAIDEDVMDFNGNDPLLLVYKGIGIDEFGISGGTNFAKDKGMLRNSSQKFPSSDWESSEWTVIASDNFDDFGKHLYDFAEADTLFAIASGNWSDKSIWATSKDGISGYFSPTQKTVVIISGYEVLVNSNSLCSDIKLLSNLSSTTSLHVENCSLTVLGEVILNDLDVHVEISGTGSLTCIPNK